MGPKEMIVRSFKEKNGFRLLARIALMRVAWWALHHWPLRIRGKEMAWPPTK